MSIEALERVKFVMKDNPTAIAWINNIGIEDVQELLLDNPHLRAKEERGGVTITHEK